jgi:hypothetical protein
MATGAVRIEGLPELKRAAKAASAATVKEVNAALKQAAVPVQTTAQRLATGLDAGPKWSRMRIGVSMRKVYVVAAARRTSGTPRPNFGGRILTGAMAPALAQNETETMLLMGKALDKIADIFEKG